MCGCGCELAIVLAEVHPETPAVGSERDMVTASDTRGRWPVSALDWISRLFGGLVPGWRATR